MTMSAMSDSDDDSDSSLRSTGSQYESDTDDDLDVDAAPPDGQWTYVARSIRGGKTYEGLSKRVLPNNNFQLEYNYADPILLGKTKAEVKHSLSAIRTKLLLEGGAPWIMLPPLLGQCPSLFLLSFMSG